MRATSAPYPFRLSPWFDQYKFRSFTTGIKALYLSRYSYWLRAGRSGDRISVGGGRDFSPVQTGPGAHPASCTMGTESSPGVKSGRGVTLTPHPILVPWSWKDRSIPLLSVWAVRPVQSLNACTRATFTFTFLQLILETYIRGLLEKYPTFGREKETGLLGALDT